MFQISKCLFVFCCNIAMDGVIKTVIATTAVTQPLILSVLSISRLFFLDFYGNLNPARWYINCKMVKFKTPLFVLLYGQGLEIFSFYFTA